jgi:hypothetical protein
MKPIIFAFLFSAVIYSCTNDKKEKADNIPPVVEKKIDSTLVTDSAWGLVTATTDVEGLKSFYGAVNVKDERICGPECIDSIDVTKIYAETPREIIVYWKDSAYHKNIGMMESYAEGSPYHTATGLKNGSSLRDILSLNGKKITFSGFGWDYGGYIQSYNNGTLEKSPIHFRLDLMEDDGTELLGDTELNTDMPAVQKKLDKIKVYQLSLSFHKDGN